MAWDLLQAPFAALLLVVNQEKSRLTTLAESFAFLGFEFRKTPGRMLYRWPQEKAWPHQIASCPIAAEVSGKFHRGIIVNNHTNMSYTNRLSYLLWATRRFINADTSCPACCEAQTVLVRRKYGVTALYRCCSCDVMFRVPKSSPEESDKFYQQDYAQGFTTDCPSLDELIRLKQQCFAGTEKDYSDYIEILRAVTVNPGCTIFDFGCSWGYGSWQLGQAGYRVYSFEISRPRARYAVQNLQCTFCAPSDLSEKVDCFFSAHVIEHLPNPRALWEVASKVVKPSGIVCLFLPNGDPSRERRHSTYHQCWGQVHPLLLSPNAMIQMGKHYGFNTRCYTSPYDIAGITKGMPGEVMGDELLVLASR